MPPGIINGWNTWKEIHRRRGTRCPDQVSFPDHLGNLEKWTDKFGNIGQPKMKLNGNRLLYAIRNWLRYWMESLMHLGWKEEHLQPPRSLITGPRSKTSIPPQGPWLQFKHLLLPSLIMGHLSKIIHRPGQKHLPILLCSVKLISSNRSLCLLHQYPFKLKITNNRWIYRHLHLLYHLLNLTLRAGKKK